MIYISGPMTGYEDHNFPAFDAAEQALKDVGWTVCNPSSTGIMPGWEWSDYLRHDLRLLTKCAFVATLNGWEESRGACLEVHVAQALGMPVGPLASWITGGRHVFHAQ